MRTVTGRRLRLFLAAVLAATALMAFAPTPAQAQSTGCASVGTAFDRTGPFSVTTQSTSTHTFYSPSNLGSNGCTTHPVILWGNGTFTSVSFYDGYLRHMASHGFIVAAANTSNALIGSNLLPGLDQLRTWNQQAGHRFNGKVNLDMVGATGHSQGGGAAQEAGKDARVDTIFPFEPWLGSVPGLRASSALYFAGQNDWVVSPSSVRSRYTQTSQPSAYAELRGASHFTALGNMGGFRGAATAWARWKLMGDTTARQQFVGSNCGLCNNFSWSAYVANAALQTS
jgi:Chlorophyllase enzyme